MKRDALFATFRMEEADLLGLLSLIEQYQGTPTWESHRLEVPHAQFRDAIKVFAEIRTTGRVPDEVFSMQKEELALLGAQVAREFDLKRMEDNDGTE